MLIQLSRRLQVITDMIQDDYHHIWDTCCDHGLLGLQLLHEHPNSVIHFVDQVSEITEALTHTLSTQHPNTTHWQVHTLDCSQLSLFPADKKHLVVIAGVGGELAKELVSKIHEKHLDQIIEFIICPVHHTYALREELIGLNYRLLDETIVEENKRFYEVIHVTNDSKQSEPPSLTGNMWDKDDEAHIRYLNKLITHYDNKAKSGDESSRKIAKAYKSINDKPVT